MHFQHNKFIVDKGLENKVELVGRLIGLWQARDDINGRFLTKYIQLPHPKSGVMIVEIVFGTKNGKGDGIYRLKTFKFVSPNEKQGTLFLGDFEPLEFAFGNELRFPPEREIRESERKAFLDRCVNGSEKESFLDKYLTLKDVSLFYSEKGKVNLPQLEIFPLTESRVKRVKFDRV